MKTKKQKLKATIRLVKKQPPQTFVEDVLQQKSYEIEDVLNAKLKHPLAFWAKVKWFFFSDAIKTKCSVLKGRTKRILRKVGLLKNK